MWPHGKRIFCWSGRWTQIFTICIYRNSIKGTNAKAKANAATGIPELIEIAVGKHFRENNEDKHRRDGKNGWYRYDSKFALPVYDDNGKVERYNIFHASVLIRHSNDGGCIYMML